MNQRLAILKYMPLYVIPVHNGTSPVHLPASQSRSGND